MYIMDYSSNIRGLVDPDRKSWPSDVSQAMIAADLPNGSYVQMRDDDGNVFRLVVKNGDVQKISPKWDM